MHACMHVNNNYYSDDINNKSNDFNTNNKTKINTIVIIFLNTS